jgi:FAD/FMN-containing dehydrogenase
MHRRQFLQSTAALAGAAAFAPLAARATPLSRVRPGQPGWPGTEAWAELGRDVGGRLAPVTVPQASAAELANPFFVGDQPGLSQSSGWLDAWRAAPSAYAVAAESTADVVAAVNFARSHNLRLVIKGRGHSYLGGSTAPDSLLLWTRRMDQVTVHDAFTPQGASGEAVPAVSCGAGAMWLQAYRAVTGGGGRYVQGGGCTTVGVAGLVQGGGFGSFSKGFGTGAASLLEAEIVTADGAVHVVNAVREPELFWALKGGGGGTFGAVTRLTLATHPLPQAFGAVSATLHARSDAAFRRLIARFVDLYADGLAGPHWGEQVRAGPNNRLVISMVFQGLTQEAARAAFAPLAAFCAASPGDYEGHEGLMAFALPARRFWDADFLRQLPGVVRTDQRPGASPGAFWWAGDGEQVGAFWHAYSSAWLPQSLLQAGQRQRLADAWYAASRHWGVAFHFNKGLAGAEPAVLHAARETATNPQVTEAFALAIIADHSGPAFGAAGPATPARARHGRDSVHRAMTALRACAPDAGAYVNECDYFQADWQQAFWGSNYERLLRVKRRYDPDGLFTVHHGVGSENWSADGFTRS